MIEKDEMVRMLHAELGPDAPDKKVRELFDWMELKGNMVYDAGKGYTVLPEVDLRSEWELILNTEVER